MDIALSRSALARLRVRRLWWLRLFDVVGWGAALAVAALARMDFYPSLVPWTHVALAWAIVAVLHLGAGWVVKLHHGRAALATLEEMMLLGLVTTAAGSALFLTNLWLRPPLPRSVPLIAMFVAIAIMASGRASWRVLTETERRRQVEREGSSPVIVVGAGDGGRQFIKSMLRGLIGDWHPIALLDDDPSKRHLRIYGVPVMGTSKDIAKVARATGAALVVVAIPTAHASLVRRVSEASAEANLKVKVVPGVDELLYDRVNIYDVRDVNLEDLLGRRQVETDLESIAGYLTDKRVLVTGAGGSIGSELCRQISLWRPTELIMLDRDESALHAVQLSISGQALLDTADVVLGDIRDNAFVTALFEERRPQVVFHAAALKHLPILEQYPGEAVKTNVWGTLSVLEAATAAGVERFVNISTDKAANPCSVLGYTKRIAEGLTAAAAADTKGSFLSVRFGNVLGSRGSVLDTFTAQIAAGGPLTVTHPDVTRFFMTIREAVELVIQAAAIGSNGQALILDMGVPVRIEEVARQLIDLSGKDVAIRYTGLRHGEKMREQLLGDEEPDHRPVHPLVSHVNVPPVSSFEVRGLNPWATKAAVMQALSGLCGGMDGRNGFPHPEKAASRISV